MSELTTKLLESGLVDAATADLMVRWGLLDEEKADLVHKEELKTAGREELIKFAESVEAQLEKARKLRETTLDLNQMKWPANVAVWSSDRSKVILPGVPALVDRLGRYYFRPADAPKGSIIPGYLIHRLDKEIQASAGNVHDIYVEPQREQILEVTELFVGDQVAAIQVSTK